MLGVCLAVLTAASGASIAEVRLGLRRLAEQLEPVGKVLDDGSHVQLAPLWPRHRRSPTGARPRADAAAQATFRYDRKNRRSGTNQITATAPYSAYAIHGLTNASTTPEA